MSGPEDARVEAIWAATEYFCDMEGSHSEKDISF